MSTPRSIIAGQANSGRQPVLFAVQHKARAGLYKPNGINFAPCFRCGGLLRFYVDCHDVSTDCTNTITDLSIITPSRLFDSIFEGISLTQTLYARVCLPPLFSWNCLPASFDTSERIV